MYVCMYVCMRAFVNVGRYMYVCMMVIRYVDR